MSINIITDRERALLARMELLQSALKRIAAFDEGPVVTRSFDEPCAAAIARTALEQAQA